MSTGRRGGEMEEEKEEKEEEKGFILTINR